MNKVYGDAPAVAHPHFDSLYFFSAQFRLKLFRSLSTCPRCPWISHRPSAASSAPIFLFSIRFALLIVSVYIVKQKTQRVQYFFAAAAPAASGVRRAKIRTKDKKGDGSFRISCSGMLLKSSYYSVVICVIQTESLLPNRTPAYL